ncbi:putative peptidoglycan binding domain protein [bacterium BMS3Bbin01]|nr:putative peptidoglycan binding domain protein [bacterium BMS3Bbin01]
MRRRVALWVAVAIVGVGALGFWAGRRALVPPGNPLTGAEALTYTVQEGEVGRSLTFTAVAEWDLTPVGRNGASGVVTSMPVAVGDAVSAGDVLYTVDLRPVVIAQGAVPAFRTLLLETEGPDVAQLQGLLVGLGLLSVEPDGVFGRSTRDAVKVWQKGLGVESDGVVRSGDVLFVPTLPIRVVFSDVLEVGARLSGGEQVVSVVPDDPTFRIPLSIEQRSLVPLSADVHVTYPEGVWDARVDRAVESAQFGQLDLLLTGAGGRSVCGSECARWVDLVDRTDFRAEVVVIPRTSGPLVPVAAISTDAANQPFVTTVDGERVPVTIVAASQGVAVVDGIDVGTILQLPFETTGQGAGSG